MALHKGWDKKVLDKACRHMIWGYPMKLRTSKPRSKSQRPPRGLTASDRKFIDAYLITGNASEAYLAAGFNGNNVGANGYKMLNKASIQRFLAKVEDKAITKVAKKLEITVDKVIEDLETARITALGAMPAPQCAAAIKASELQGKHIGMFRDDYADREQMPMIIINSGEGTQIAVVGRAQGPDLPPAMQRTPMISDDMEYLTDADLL